MNKTEKVEVLEKPEKPLPSECCGGGSCCPCVWDDYFDKLEKWQAAQNRENTKSSCNSSTNSKD